MSPARAVLSLRASFFRRPAFARAPFERTSFRPGDLAAHSSLLNSFLTVTR